MQKKIYIRKSCKYLSAKIYVTTFHDQNLLVCFTHRGSKSYLQVDVGALEKCSHSIIILLSEFLEVRKKFKINFLYRIERFQRES